MALASVSWMPSGVKYATVLVPNGLEALDRADDASVAEVKSNCFPAMLAAMNGFRACASSLRAYSEAI